MKIKNNKLIFPLIAFLITGMLFSTDYYVDQNYNGSNGSSNGSEERPCTTINQCLGMSSNSGATRIFVSAGEYTENIQLGNRELIGKSVHSCILNALSGDYVVLLESGKINNFTFKQFDQYYPAYLIKIAGGGYTGAKITQNIFSSNSDYGSIYFPESTGAVISNNLFTDNVKKIQINNEGGTGSIVIKNNFWYEPNFDTANVINCNNCENTSNSVMYIYNNLLKSCTITDYGIDQVSYNACLNSDSCGENAVKFDTWNDLGWVSNMSTALEYHLFAIDPQTSILFDSGHPDFEHNDPDGSRGDIGLFGGAYSWATMGPVITDFDVDPVVVPLDGTIQINARAITE